MHTVNFEGLAQASAALIVWPIVDEDNQPIASLDAAKLVIGSVTMTLGTGLTFSNSEITADLTNDRAANLAEVQQYELWVQIGPDKLAVVRGTMTFIKTKVRI